MGEFQKKLDSLLNEISKTKRNSEKKQWESEIIELITVKFAEHRDYTFILTIIEKAFNKRKTQVLPEAVAGAIESIAVEHRKEFFDILKSKPKKAFIYYVIAYLLYLENMQDGISLLNYCCNKVTDEGKKFPAKNITNAMHTAFFVGPALKERPMKILSEEEIETNTAVCLLYLVSNPELRKKRKGNSFPLIETVIISKGGLAWTKLPEGDRNFLTQHFKDIFTNMRASQSSEDIAEVLRLPKELLLALDIETDQTPSKSYEISVPNKADSAVRHDMPSGPLPNVNRTSEARTKPNINTLPDASKIGSQFDPIYIAQQLYDWVVEKKHFIERIESQTKMVGEENSELKRRINTLSFENKKLENKIEALKRDLENRNIEFGEIKTKYDRHVQETERKIKTFAEESERREKRIIQEAKNRLKRDLNIFVHELIILNGKENIPDKAGRQGKIFKNIIKTMDMHGIRFEK